MSDVIEATQKTLNADMMRLTIIGQNMANINSPSFKRGILLDQGFSALLDSSSTTANNPSSHSVKDHSFGALMPTENGLDLAIEGNGYLNVRNKDSQSLLYTRRGQLMINEQGYLALRSGEIVMGERGNIPLNGSDFEIRRNGEIYQEGRLIDRLRVVDFSTPSKLEYLGGGLFRGDGLATGLNKSEITVLQGYLEKSNVNMMEEMVRLVEVSRHFEMTHNVLRAYDGTLDSAINVLGSF